MGKHTIHAVKNATKKTTRTLNVVKVAKKATGTKMTVFNREPAQWLGLIAAAIQLMSALFFPLTIEQQGTLNAVAVAVFGILTAFAVNAEKAAPLVGGFLQAILACALAFGVHLSPEMQSSAMAFVTAAVALFMRTQVVAPGSPNSALTESVA